MSSRPHILIIENSIDVTGALKSITAMAIELSDRYDFFFILPANSRAKEWLQSRSKFEVIVLPMLEIRRNWRTVFYFPRLLMNALRLNRIIKEYNIDIVHSNDLYNLVGPTAKRFRSFKYVCHIRFMPDGFPKRLFNFWLARQLKHAHEVVVVSEH